MAEPVAPALDPLSDTFPECTTAGAAKAFTDSEIQHVASLLRQSEREGWSKVPRTYLVLREIKRLGLMKGLLDSGFTDFCFPVGPRSLPPALDPSDRRAIIAAQHIVLTKSVDLENGENGRHRHFAKDDLLPFKTVERLGSGKYSQVDHVRSTISGNEYALKRILRRTTYWNISKQAVEQFASETQLIKSVKHKHIVQFVGSFTAPQYLGILMSPVADMDLAEYMDQKSVKMPSLRSFFGCLSTALQYLHYQSIRHRDIKPQNILVEGANVLLTDFGLSKNYSDDPDSTTSGATALTYRYAAPEVAAGGARNASADIWSLGCVFLEMTVVLKGYSIEWLRKYLSENGTKDPFISRNIQGVDLLVKELEVIGKQSDNRMLSISRSMLQLERESRPTAAAIVDEITTPCEDEASATSFCGLCCLEEDASDYNDSLTDDLGVSSLDLSDQKSSERDQPIYVEHRDKPTKEGPDSPAPIEQLTREGSVDDVARNSSTSQDSSETPLSQLENPFEWAADHELHIPPFTVEISRIGVDPSQEVGERGLLEDPVSHPTPWFKKLSNYSLRRRLPSSAHKEGLHGPVETGDVLDQPPENTQPCPEPQDTIITQAGFDETLPGPGAYQSPSPAMVNRSLSLGSPEASNRSVSTPGKRICPPIQRSKPFQSIRRQTESDIPDYSDQLPWWRIEPQRRRKSDKSPSSTSQD